MSDIEALTITLSNLTKIYQTPVMKVILEGAEIDRTRGEATYDGVALRFYAYTHDRIYFLVEDDEVSGLHVHSIPRNPSQETVNYSGQFDYTLSSLIHSQ